MFIFLKYPTHQEQIPILSIVRFVTFPNKIVITLSEVERKVDSSWDFGYVANKVLEIPQESQPEAFLQIQEYIKSNTSL
jgi:hypothetical protein